MIEGIWTVALQFHFWEFMFRIFGIISLQCRIVVKKIGFELLKKNNCYVDKIIPQNKPTEEWRVWYSRGNFWIFLIYVSYSILLSAAPQISRCWRMLGSNPMTVATLALTSRRSNLSARSHPQSMIFDYSAADKLADNSRTNFLEEKEES